MMRHFQHLCVAIVVGGGIVSGMFLGELRAANIAPSANAVGSSSAVNNVTVINNGDLTDSVGTSAFWVPPSGRQGMGYDLGGFATLNSLDIYQHSAAGGGGLRQRLSSAVVHTSQSSILYRGLPDTDVLSLPLFGVDSSFVLVQPLTQHPAAPDSQVGVREIQVDSTLGVIAPRVNHALTASSVTLNGAGWNNGVGGDLNNNIIRWGPALTSDVSTSVFNSNIGGAGVNVTYDLGSSQSIGSLGLGQMTFGGAGARQMIRDVMLEFSSDNFASIDATRNVRFDDGVVYQQANFAPVEAQQVRITPLNQHATAPDGNIGFTELQLLAPAGVPVDLQVKNVIGGSYNFQDGSKIADGDFTTLTGSSFIGGTFPPGAGTSDGGQFGVELRGPASISAFTITQDDNGSRHRLQDITVHTSPTQSFQFTLADTQGTQVVAFAAPVDTSYLLITADSLYTTGSVDANVGISELQVVGTPTAEHVNHNLGILPTTVGGLGGFDNPVVATDGVVHTQTNSTFNSTFFARNAGQDSITVNYGEDLVIGSIGLGLAIDTTPIGVRDQPNMVTLLYDGGSIDIDLAGEFLQYGQYDLPFDIETDFLTLQFPDGNDLGAWFLHNDANYGITEFQAFAPTAAVPEPATLIVWSLLGLVGFGYARARRRR